MPFPFRRMVQARLRATLADGALLEWPAHLLSGVASPVLQRHIGIARVRPDLSAEGTELRLELAINHHNTTVRVRTSTMPFYDPERKKA